MATLLPSDVRGEGVAALAEVVAVAGHPVETGHVTGEHFIRTLEADIDLRAADRQQRAALLPFDRGQDPSLRRP